MYIEYEMDQEEKENLENLVFYYRNHGVENIMLSHPYFLVDDMEKILEFISNLLEV